MNALRRALSLRGLRAAVEVGAQHGVRCEEPIVLRDSSNLLVRLAPAPVVARVSTVTSMARTGDACPGQTQPPRSSARWTSTANATEPEG